MFQETFIQIMLVSSTYPPDSCDNVIKDRHRTIVTQIHLRRHQQYHVRLFFIKFFSPVNAVVKQTPVLAFHTTQRACLEIIVKCLSQEHNDVMPSMGVEPAALRSLAR